MKESHGFWWPDKDSVCAALLTEEVEDLALAILYCEQFRTAIQAGGNVGVYPKWLSRKFKTVVTAEPDPDNYKLLKKNTADCLNLMTHPYAFGHRACRRGMVQYQENCGASHIVMGDEIRVSPIDHVRLLDVDFIQLDVEGFEQQVLEGARDTIARCRPVLMVEDRGHEKRFGGAPLIPWIEDTFRYEKVLELHHDVVLVPIEKLR